MALTFLPASLVIESSSSITDLPAFHAELRDWEDSELGAVHPVTHTWRALDLGGGAFFYQVDLANGWRLRFPTPGNYTITGNLNAEILPVAGVYVERKTSAAFVTTAVGGSGPTAGDIWSESIEGGLSAKDILRLLLAVNAGSAAGLESASMVFKSADGTKNRVAASYSGGARTITGLDPT